MSGNVAHGSTVANRVFRFKVLIFGLVTSILGMGLIILSEHIPNTFAKSITHELAVALIISAVSALAYEFFAKKDFVSLVQETVANSTRTVESKLEQLIDEASRTVESLHLSSSCTEHGLVEINNDANTYDYKSMILVSRELTVVVNDGRSWLSRNLDALTERFRDLEKTTCFVLLHPDSIHLETLSSKLETSVDAQRQRIIESINMICDVAGEALAKNKVVIKGHHLFNAHSLYIDEVQAVVTLYFIGKGRGAVPLFRYERTEKTSFYNDYSEGSRKSSTTI